LEKTRPLTAFTCPVSVSGLADGLDAGVVAGVVCACGRGVVTGFLARIRKKKTAPAITAIRINVTKIHVPPPFLADVLATARPH